MAQIRLWTDGACWNNGYPGAAAGYGVLFENGKTIKGILDPGTPQTNQRAELKATLVALQDVCKQIRRGEWSGRNYGSYRNFSILIYSDSKYAINSCTVWLEKWLGNGFQNARGSPVVNGDLVYQIHQTLQLPEIGQVSFQYVEAHSGNKGNEIADSLANEAIRKGVTFERGSKGRDWEDSDTTDDDSDY